jgi:hypothetical protein
VAPTRVVGCVGTCAQSNVVIVRLPDGPSLWFGGIVDETLTGQLCEWLTAGTPLPLPDRLARHPFERVRQPGDSAISDVVRP